jgi:Skp family chaperone for outer membrane proteins
MRVLKSSMMVAALTLALSAPVFAQTAPPAGAPKPQTPAQPPATPPAATQPAPKPAPPVPFPQDAKIGFIDINAIAATSAAGKEATKRLAALDEKKRAELGEKQKQLQALNTKLNTSGGVLSDSASSQLKKEIEKMTRELEYSTSSAQAEMQELQNDLQAEFQKRLLPVIEEIAKEKGLHAVFSVADSGAAYVHPGLNLSEEIVKRLDTKK